MSADWLAMRVLILAAILPVAHAKASSADEALCRGSYPVMLMTDQECGAYAGKLHTLRAQGQTRALETLQRRHEEQLAERATLCPCVTGQTPEAEVPQRLAIFESDC